MMNELYAPMNLDRNDLENFIKHSTVLQPLFSVIKELNYPKEWYEPLIADIRGTRTAFDQQALQSEKRQLVQFLYEFARAVKDVALFKKLQNSVSGIDYLEKELSSRLLW